MFPSQPHGHPQHALHQPPAGQDHGGPPLLHRHHLRHLPVSQTHPQYLRGLSGNKDDFKSLIKSLEVKCFIL